MTKDTRKKIEVAVVALSLLGGSYLVIKYILPLVWPFILAYGLASLISPVVRFLKDRLHFHKNAASALTLIFALGGIITVIYYLIRTIVQQIMSFAESWPEYQEKFFVYLDNMCEMLEGSLGIEQGVIFKQICDGLSNFAQNTQRSIMPTVVSNSIPTVMALLNVIIVAALTLMSVFYMVRDMDKMHDVRRNNIFYREIKYIKGLIGKILKAYVKSQAIIISVVAVVCAIGLAFIGNDYNIVIGIIVGISDALPLIGAGTIMIPWSIVYFFMGEYFKAGILITIFVVCYLLREFLEPRLMGQKIGMSPIATLVSIYVGYQLFGFMGMIAGPLVAVMIREIMQKVVKEDI